MERRRRPMERAEILDILTDWNFWARDPDTGIPREGPLKGIQAIAAANEITVVTGIRRGGKSTLLLQLCASLIRSGTRKEDILIVNFEDPRFRGLSLDLLNRIYEVYQTEMAPSARHTVILDEVQAVEGWERFARYLHENKRVRVFVTGSSSKLLSSEYATVLAGRHLDTEVRPLSFPERLRFAGIPAASAAERSANRHAIQRAFSEYLRWGGFPKVALAKDEHAKRELLAAYFRDIIVKDLVRRHRIKEVGKLEDLAKHYLTNVSTLQSFNKVKHLLALNLDTVERFSGYLSEVFLLSFVRKFSYSRKEQLLNPRKVYCADTGLRNSVGFVFSEDLGRLAENIAYARLAQQGQEVYYWKGRHEADFIAKRGRELQAIQVCWDPARQETRGRELAGLAEACAALRLKRGLVLTQDEETEERISGITVRFLPLWKWLLEPAGAKH